jgi:hypothetical protein
MVMNRMPPMQTFSIQRKRKAAGMATARKPRVMPTKTICLKLIGSGKSSAGRTMRGYATGLAFVSECVGNRPGARASGTKT